MLVHLVECLKPGEVQFIKDFYTAKYNRTNNKRLRLFEIILKYQPLDNQKACQLLYKKNCSSAFSHLKKKIHEDILNFLLLNSSCSSDSNDAQSEEITCRKILLQGKILVSRGIYNQGIDLLEKAGRIAEQFEFPDLKIAALDLLRDYRDCIKGSDSFNYYNDQMEKALNTFEKILKAREMKYTVHFEQTNNPVNDISPFKNVSENVVMNKPNESKRAYFWHQMNLINRYISSRNFHVAKNIAQQLLAVLSSTPALDCAYYHAEIYQIQARISIYLGQYEEAIYPARKSFQLFGEGTYERLNAISVLFFAYYRNQCFQNAEEIVEFSQGKNFYQLKSSQPWGLMKAALKFSHGQYHEVGRILNNANEIKDCDKSWTLGQRLLELLNILELKDYEWFEFKIESFRKKLAYSKCFICPRLTTIYDIFKTLRNTNYDFDKTVGIHQKNLNLINASDSSCYWDPMGYEMVHVGKWVEKKVMQHLSH